MPIQTVVPFTIGYDPRMGNRPFVGHRYGSGAEVNLTRMFLFGEPEDNSRWVRQADDFGEGQQHAEAHGLPSFMVKINGRVGGRFSREVVAACSQGIRADRVAALEQGLLAITQPELGDVAVTLTELLHRPTTLGYPIDPVIRLGRDDDLEILNLPVGMRLFLIGAERKSL